MARELASACANDGDFPLSNQKVGALDEAEVRAAMRKTCAADGDRVREGGGGMYELTAAYEKVRSRL